MVAMQKQIRMSTRNWQSNWSVWWQMSFPEMSCQNKSFEAYPKEPDNDHSSSMQCVPLQLEHTTRLQLSKMSVINWASWFWFCHTSLSNMCVYVWHLQDTFTNKHTNTCTHCMLCSMVIHLHWHMHFDIICWSMACVYTYIYIYICMVDVLCACCYVVHWSEWLVWHV